MLGNELLCILEIAYYINKKALRLSHIYCNYYCNSINHIIYNKDKDIISLSTNINKIVCIRIPKFRERNYKIIFNNCNHNNCLYIFIKLIDYYKRNNYMVKFTSFLEIYYNNTYEDNFIKNILNKIYKDIQKYDDLELKI